MKSQSYTNLLIPSLVFSPRKKKKRERSKLPLYDWKSTHRFIMIWRSLPGTLTTINCLYLLFTETFMVLDCSSREGGESLNNILYFNRSHSYITSSLVPQMVKHLPTMWETWVQSPGWGDLLEKEMATHSSTLAWKSPWTEEPGRLQSMGSQRVGHDWVTSLSLS